MTMTSIEEIDHSPDTLIRKTDDEAYDGKVGDTDLNDKNWLLLDEGYQSPRCYSCWVCRWINRRTPFVWWMYRSGLYNNNNNNNNNNKSVHLPVSLR